MSTPENGLPGNIIATLPAAVAITSSATDGAGHTNITTAAAHGLTQGDYVDIQGHVTNVAVNGRWAVFGVVSATVYAITLVTGTGGTGGTSQSLAFSTTGALPADGVDLEDAASVNVPFEALFDRTAFLMLMTGAWTIAGAYSQQLDRDIGGATAWNTIPSVINTGIWASVQAPSVSSPVGLPGLLPGDMLLAYGWTTVGAITTTGGTTLARFGMGLYNASSGLITTAIVAKFPACAQYLPIAAVNAPISLFAAYPVTAAAAVGTQTVFCFEPVDGANSGCTFVGDGGIITLVLRPTGKPQ